MSRREDRSAESKRRHSRFDREPSPKRSRRDGKPENERPITDVELDRDRVDRDHKNRHRRLQDPLPLEAPLSHNSKVESGTGRKESENRADGHHGGSRHSNDPTKVPQSRKYFQQHDDRDSVGQIGRNFSRRTDSDRGWWRDSRDQQNDATINKNPSSDTHQKDEKAKETGLDRNPPALKRPSFSEQKIPTDPEKANKAAANPTTPNPQNHSIDSGRRDERGHNYRHSERSHQDWRGNFSTRDRDRSIGGSRYRGRDNNRFGGRQGYNRPSGGRVDKWKHDLYDEASKSPNPKNEEDQISKIEALLAS